MKTSSLTGKARLFSHTGLANGLLRSAVLRQLGQLRHGQLRVIEQGESMEFGPGGHGPHAEIEIIDSAAWGLIAGNGSIGAGEAYIHGY